MNETDGEVWVDLAQILEGRTYEELLAYIDEARQSAEAGAEVMHRPDYLGAGILAMLDAGESKTQAGSLPPGTYGIVCLRRFEGVPDPEIRPFAGIGPLEVVDEEVSQGHQ